MISQSVGTARTYAFVGFIFYVLPTVAWIIGILLFAFFFAASVSTSMQPGPTPPTTIVFPVFGIVGLVFLFLFAPSIILTIFAWITVRDIDTGKHAQARTNSLILGIIGLLFGLLIGGIFFLLAYSRLGESAVQPLPLRFCVNCGRPVPPDAKFCSHCGKELPP